MPLRLRTLLGMATAIRDLLVIIAEYSISAMLAAQSQSFEQIATDIQRPKTLDWRTLSRLRQLPL